MAKRPAARNAAEAATIARAGRGGQDRPATAPETQALSAVLDAITAAAESDRLYLDEPITLIVVRALGRGPSDDEMAYVQTALYRAGFRFQPLLTGDAPAKTLVVWGHV